MHDGGHSIFLGIDAISGMDRFAFGIPGLLNGVSFISALISLLAVSQLLIAVEKKVAAGKETAECISTAAKI